MTWRAFGGYSLAGAIVFAGSVITQLLLGRPFTGGVLFVAAFPAIIVPFVLYFKYRRTTPARR